jgi:hypothetical protein
MSVPARRLVRPSAAKKRRCSNVVLPFCIAVRPKDSEGGGDLELAAGRGQQDWELLGFCQFERVEHFDPPTSSELKLIEGMRLIPRVPLVKWTAPVAAVVQASGLFARPIKVSLPVSNVQVVDLPQCACSAISQTVLVGSDSCMDVLFGPSLARWKVWKCDFFPTV